MRTDTFQTRPHQWRDPAEPAWAHLPGKYEQLKRKAAELKRRRAQQERQLAREQARREKAAAKAASRLQKHRSEETVHGGSEEVEEQLQHEALTSVGMHARVANGDQEGKEEGKHGRQYLSFFGWHKGSQQHRRSSQIKGVGSSVSI